jgi:group I intron endonuclease
MKEFKSYVLAGVYVIRNAKTGRSYVGESANIANRWAQHLYELSNNTHHNQDLQHDWNKYPRRYFCFHVVSAMDIYDSNRRRAIEQETIDDLEARGKLLYNVRHNHRYEKSQTSTINPPRMSDEERKQAAKRINEAELFEVVEQCLDAAKTRKSGTHRRDRMRLLVLFFRFGLLAKIKMSASAMPDRIREFIRVNGMSIASIGNFRSRVRVEKAYEPFRKMYTKKHGADSITIKGQKDAV